MARCEIKWIDAQGAFTGDTNEAIGLVRCKAHNSTVSGKVIHFEASEWFYICEDHKARLANPGMENWEFKPL